MAVDGIGRANVPATSARSVGVDARRDAKTFEVPGEAAGSLPPAAPACAPDRVQGTALERLRAGELDRDGYLDAKVDEATAHLAGLRSEDLDLVKTVLREQLESDPVLVRLATQVVGKDSG